MLEDFGTWFDENGSDLIDDLRSYLEIDTSHGQEGSALPILERVLSKYGFDYRVEPFSEKAGHPAWTPGDAAVWPFNVHAWADGHSDTTVLFNSHIDVVPASPSQQHPFLPDLREGAIYARGACDTKSNLFLLLGAVKYLRDRNVPIKYNILLDLVSGEEVGGNGTLSTLVSGRSADLAVVFEPTNLVVYRGHRGCLTCKASFTGRGVHMGSDVTGKSAILAAVSTIGRLQILEGELLAAARGHSAFSIWPRPVQINVGVFQGGEWPGSVPERSELVFNVGFATTDTIASIERKVTEAIFAPGGVDGDVSVDLDFHTGLRNEAYLSVEDDPEIRALSEAASLVTKSDAQGRNAWKVSCDARHYANVGSIPTVIFGAGSLADAHSAHEHVSITELRNGMSILALYLSGYSNHQ